MKLDKLARQLRRDVAASPKKAVALGLMVLVALYFWAPMVWKWIAPDQGKGKSTVSVSDVILEDDPIDLAAKAKRERQDFAWEKVRRKLLADPRMSSAVYEIAWHDPFRADGLTDPARATATAAAQAAEAQSDPNKLGLVLTSVVVGSTRRSAVISGENYQEGQIVPGSGKKDQPPGGIEFRLVRVGFHEIELERLGRTYTLKLSRPQLAPGDELSGPARQ